MAPMRERYMALYRQPTASKNSCKLAPQGRKLSHPFMEQLREAVGACGLQACSARAAPQWGQKRQACALVSFRDEDGKFRFRLIAGDGQELLLSEAFDEPKAAGVAMAALKREPFDALAAEVQGGVAITVQGNVVAHVEATALPLVREAIAALQQD